MENAGWCGSFSEVGKVVGALFVHPPQQLEPISMLLKRYSVDEETRPKKTAFRIEGFQNDCDLNFEIWIAMVLCKFQLVLHESSKLTCQSDRRCFYLGITCGIKQGYQWVMLRLSVNDLGANSRANQVGWSVGNDAGDRRCCGAPRSYLKLVGCPKTLFILELQCCSMMNKCLFVM